MKTITLTDVLYTPACGMHQIISVVQLLRKEVKFNTALETGTAAHHNGKAVYGASTQSGLFILQTLPMDMAHAANRHTANAYTPVTDIVPIRPTISSKSILLRHARLRHLVLSVIKHIVAKKTANGIETHTKSPASRVCEACIILRKLYRKSFRPPERDERQNGLLELIHSNTANPMETPTYQGVRHMITFTEGSARWT